MGLIEIINKVLPPLGPAPKKRKITSFDSKFNELKQESQVDICDNCAVRAAWKTLRASLTFKDDEETKKVLAHMDKLEEQYDFEVK